MNNWEAESQTLDKGHVIGLIEPVMLVKCNDPIWNDTEENTSLRVCQIKGLGEQKEELRKRLQISGSCTEEDHKQSEELLLQLNGVHLH